MPVDPSTLAVVTYPAPILRTRSTPVEGITDEVRAVALRMIELMFASDGIGLAANQVGLPWRLFVAHVPASDDPDDPRSPESDTPTATGAPTVYINPVLSDPERDLTPMEEGCLSLPEIHGEVRRPSQITITALDLQGRRFTQRGAGLLARCWQHEVDHLEGVLILDRMTPASRLRNRARVRDLEDGAQGRPS
ncbi:MAG TPA: peptide deformylase [Phycisphaerales bacterium]|nr:peptide deformylase [Phycisphaerales bacterium]